ncbi:hypothetical protein BDF20DRAFT_880809, partial [Mycotypha africana]|uniref:uncharacterized protein n=1 Tax=Mycotypha africana TaxID=64632 RepID=UPI0023013FD2
HPAIILLLCDLVLFFSLLQSGIQIILCTAIDNHVYHFVGSTFPSLVQMESIFGSAITVEENKSSKCCRMYVA